MLNNKITLITGASAGIGEACAHAFAREGSHLILAARRMEKVEALAAHLTTEYGIKTHALKLDVRDREAVNATIEGLPAEWSDRRQVVREVPGVDGRADGHHSAADVDTDGRRH